MNFAPEYVVGVCFFVLLFWFLLFPQGQELEKGLIVGEGFPNEHQAMKILNCQRGNWVVDGNLYVVDGSKFREEYGTHYCNINGKWYDTDYLNERSRGVRDTFMIRELIEQKNKTFETLVYEEISVCRNITVPANTDMDFSAYNVTKVDFDTGKITLTSCKIEKEKKYQISEEEVYRITQLVLGGIE